MSFLEEFVEVTVSHSNRSRYSSLGYKTEGVRTLLVAVRDLPKSSKILVTPICDNCRKVGRKRKYCLAFRDQMYGKDYCTQCMYDINVSIEHSGRESSGERAVRTWLESRGIDYRAQVRRKGVTGVWGRPLLFDFAVLGETGEPVAFIEYDGEQHYRPVIFAGDDPDPDEVATKFAYQQEHDRRKDRYCESNGVPMIRIKYDVPLEEIGRELDRVKEVLRCA